VEYTKSVISLQRSALLVIGLSALSVSCESETDTREPIVRTGMGIDPLDFLGTVPCEVTPGAAQSYVATLTDLSTGEIVKSSPPLSCALPVAFENLDYCVDGQDRCNAYRADIDVYTQAVSAITPKTSGGRETNQTPAWTTKCGPDTEVDDAPRAIPSRRVFIRPCVALEGSGMGTTSISVPTQNVVSEEDCETIDELEVSVTSPAGLPKVTVACGAGPVKYGADIIPNALYEVKIIALSAGSVTKATTCQGVAMSGLESSVSCSSFTSVGNIAVDVPALLAQSNRMCGDGVKHVDAKFSFNEETLIADDATCATKLTLGPALVGAWTGEVRLVSATGTTVETFACSANVDFATTAIASCE
jgi:hypothetical protein